MNLYISDMHFGHKNELVHNNKIFQDEYYHSGGSSVGNVCRVNMSTFVHKLVHYTEGAKVCHIQSEIEKYVEK